MIKNEADLIGKKKKNTYVPHRNQGQECTWTLGYLCPGRHICSILVSWLLLFSAPDCWWRKLTPQLLSWHIADSDPPKETNTSVFPGLHFTFFGERFWRSHLESGANPAHAVAAEVRHRSGIGHSYTVAPSSCVCAQSCPTLCDPVDCSPPGSSVHGISQARILEWVAISSSRGSSFHLGPTLLVGRLAEWEGSWLCVGGWGGSNHHEMYRFCKRHLQITMMMKTELF